MACPGPKLSGKSSGDAMHSHELHCRLIRAGERPPRIAPVARLRALGLCLLGLASSCDAYDARSTLAVHLLAKPASGVDGVQITVKSVEVHVAAQAAVSSSPGNADLADDGLWQSLAVSRGVDLSKAADVAAAASLGELALPQGWVDQVRVVVSAPATANSAGKQCALALAKLPKAGIEVSQPFRPFAIGHALQHGIWLDLRLDLALDKVGDCWALAPVLQVRRFTTGGKEVAVQ